MKIVFMGTPDFAVSSLERLIAEGHEVVGVFTQPDKPRGRKHILTPPPVKECALKHGIPVYQPESLKNGEAMPILSELQPDLIVVAAFGMLLKSDVLHFPKYGCINVHASLLPKYRGAAPINKCILEGETETGVTTMLMDEGLDTGDMLLSETVSIGENETAGELFDRLAVLGGNVLQKTLEALEAGNLTRTPQDDSQSTYAGMLSKEDSPVDWSRSAQKVHDQVRGLSPWPAAFTEREGQSLKIHRTQLAPEVTDELTGLAGAGALYAEKGRLFVRCGDGHYVELLEVQPQGSRKMDTKSYLLGHPAGAGSFVNS
ncbi:MAG: methionyl-tRNA formyltransferase [Clostridia bacterium]|nr:methionyl-tRNA formyltransferase [Clostridia bacterium]